MLSDFLGLGSLTTLLSNNWKYGDNSWKNNYTLFSNNGKFKAFFMNDNSAGKEVGSNAIPQAARWVQVDRKASEAWGRLCIEKPTAAALLHQLVAVMGHQNAVVIPQKVLAQMLGVTDRTIRTAVAYLAKKNWIQIVRLGKGKEAAYVVNDRVAWGQSRKQLTLSVFSATVIASQEDQPAETLSSSALRRIPSLYPGERQLPTGPGEEPPHQPHIEGLEPDMPALTEKEELERRGQLRLTDD